MSVSGFKLVTENLIGLLSYTICTESTIIQIHIYIAHYSQHFLMCFIHNSPFITTYYSLYIVDLDIPVDILYIRLTKLILLICSVEN